MRTTIIAQDRKHLKDLILETIDAEGLACDLNYIDVSQVTDMQELFAHSEFNGNISGWNTSEVRDMQGMFYNSRFNDDLSNWDVGHVVNMESMFENSIFNQDISSWDTSRVTDMNSMFEKSIFQGNILQWNTSNVVDMMFMFKNSIFNSDISSWNTSRVTDMFSMFAESEFNGDISAWNTSSVRDMDYMFRASRFNGDLSNWSFHTDVKRQKFFDSEKLDHFEIPNMYHWLLLLKGAVTEKIEWREHVGACAPIAQSLSYTELETAMLIHKAWLDKTPDRNMTLVEPFESMKYP